MIAIARARPRGPSRALEGLAWVGLLAGLLACAVASSAAPSGLVHAAFGPQDFTAWATAICGAIGALTAALNGLAIALHRWGKAPRAGRRPRPTAPEPPDHEDDT